MLSLKLKEDGLMPEEIWVIPDSYVLWGISAFQLMSVAYAVKTTWPVISAVLLALWR